MAIHRHRSCYLLCNNYLERFHKVTYMSKSSRDRKWLVRRINIIKTILQKGSSIKLGIDRNTKKNNVLH
jgi:hypothetical protein